MNCFNGARYLAEALASVQAQTFPDWEILFIDNHSTDNSAEIARAFPGRLRYLRTPEHMTLYGARDFALPHVDSEFLAFLDTDDAWEADKLERQLAAVERHGVDFVCGGARVLLQGEGKLLFTRVWDDRFIDFNLMAARYMINIQTVLLRTSLLGDLRFDPRLLIAGDYLFFLRYLQRNPRAYFLGDPLVTYRIHDQNISKSRFEVWEAEKKIILGELVPHCEAVQRQNLQRFWDKRTYRLHLKEDRFQEARAKISPHRFSGWREFVMWAATYVPSAKRYIVPHWWQ